MNKKTLFPIFVLCASMASAQNAAPPIGQIPTYYNGGFAGEAGAPRFVAYSILLDQQTSSSYGIYFSYDNFFQKLRSGIAITAGQTHSHSTSSYYDNGTIRRVTSEGHSSSLSLSFSPKFSFSGKYTLAPFVRGNIGGNSDYFFRSFSAGVLLNSRKAYFGFTATGPGLRGVSYANRPSTTPLSASSNLNPLKVEWSMQLGYTFQRKPESKFSFTPQIAFSRFRYHYESTTPISQLPPYIIGGFNSSHTYSDQGVNVSDLNLMFRYKRFLCGANKSFSISKLHDSKEFIDRWSDPDITIGYQAKSLRILLNQNYTDPGWNRTYAGKLSLRYTFKAKTDKGPITVR